VFSLPFDERVGKGNGGTCLGLSCLQLGFPFSHQRELVCLSAFPRADRMRTHCYLDAVFLAAFLPSTHSPFAVFPRNVFKAASIQALLEVEQALHERFENEMAYP